MKKLSIVLAILLTGAAGSSFAQSQHHGHGSGETGGGMPMMMESMPAQCRNFMQNMPAACMQAMEQMMGGGMHGGMMHGHGGGSPAPAARTEARAAYEDAMDKMHGPMAEGIAADDPDVAFVRGMIPHHQGAIDMAKVVEKYGDDAQIRDLARRIIEAQEAEIAEMQAWLEKNAK